jgi:hypothetical protein
VAIPSHGFNGRRREAVAAPPDTGRSVCSSERNHAGNRPDRIRHQERQTPRPKVPQTGTVTIDAASIDEGPDIETCRAGQDFDIEEVMFPGHVYRKKVYWWWGQVLEDGTCIDGWAEILPSDPEYAEKRDFILAFKRGEACTRPFAQDQSRPKHSDVEKLEIEFADKFQRLATEADKSNSLGG